MQNSNLATYYAGAWNSGTQYGIVDQQFAAAGVQGNPALGQYQYASGTPSLGSTTMSPVGPFTPMVTSGTPSHLWVGQYLTENTVTALGAIAGGTGYNDGGSGTFLNVTLSLSSGPVMNVYPTANIVVTNGVVTAVTLVTGGVGNVNNSNTVLTATAAQLGNNGGSGFTVTVAMLEDLGILVSPTLGVAPASDTTGFWVQMI